MRLAAASTFWLDLDEDFGRRFRKIFQQRGTKPALHFELITVVPVAAGLFAPPFQFEIGPGKGRGAEDCAKTFVSIWSVGGRFVDHRVDAGDEWFAKQTDC